MIVRRATTSSIGASESAANRPATQDADAGRRDNGQRLIARASEIPAASAVAPVGALAGGHCAEMGVVPSLATGGPVVSSSGRAALFGRGAQ